MPGTRNMLIGAAMAFGGIAISVLISVLLAQAGYAVAAWGLVLVGIIQFVVGLFQWINYLSMGPNARADHHLKVDVRILLRSMIAVAAADGVLRDSEVYVIELITKSFIGQALSRDTILGVFETMKGKDYSIHDELERVSNQVSPDGAAMAIKAASMVAMADGDFSEPERLEISRMANLLKLSDQQIKEYIGDARSSINRLLDAQDRARAAEPLEETNSPPRGPETPQGSI